MNDIRQHPYFQFLRFCLKPEADIPECVEQINWHELFIFGQKQAIAGVLWMGVERLTDIPNNKPTDDDVLEWMSLTTRISRRSNTVNEKARWVSKTFLKEGFRTCLLKGQGNALMYPLPLLRHAGDIDIWVEGGAEKVIDYVNTIHKGFKACYHHIEFVKAGDVDVEVHYRPSWLNNPLFNNRLQRWFNNHADACFSNSNATYGFQTPTDEFNKVFQLCHIYNHLLHEGIGLRQLIDYYYLLTHDGGAPTDLTPTLRHLGLMPIAGSVMWVLGELFDLSAEHMVCKPDKKRGRILLNEILEGGNFGYHDHRFLSGSYRSPLKKNIQRLVRDLRLMAYFPSESLWEPFFRLYHFFWRMRHNH